MDMKIQFGQPWGCHRLVCGIWWVSIILSRWFQSVNRLISICSGPSEDTHRDAHPDAFSFASDGSFADCTRPQILKQVAAASSDQIRFFFFVFDMFSSFLQSCGPAMCLIANETNTREAQSNPGSLHLPQESQSQSQSVSELRTSQAGSISIVDTQQRPPKPKDRPSTTFSAPSPGQQIVIFADHRTGTDAQTSTDTRTGTDTSSNGEVIFHLREGVSSAFTSDSSAYARAMQPTRTDHLAQAVPPQSHQSPAKLSGSLHKAVIALACGPQFYAAISETDGNLYTWGLADGADSGRLGLGPRCPSKNLFRVTTRAL